MTAICIGGRKAISMESNLMQQKERLNWLDYAKAIGMVLVVYGHASGGDFFKDWLYSFHMPLFFFLAGITMKGKEISYCVYIKKRVKQLLIPWTAYMFLDFAYQLFGILFLNKEVDMLHKMIGIFVQIRGTDYSTGSWFIPLLFGVEVLVGGIIRSSKKQQSVYVILLAIIGFLYAEFVGVVLPWGVDVIPVIVPYVYIGYCYKVKCKEPITTNSILRIFIIVLALMFNVGANLINITILGTQVDMYTMSYGNPILYYMSALAGVILIVYLCKGFLQKRDITFLKWIGKNTLHIYCLHSYIILIGKKICNYIQQFIDIPNIIFYFVLAMSTMVVCYFLIETFRKIMKMVK